MTTHMKPRWLRERLARREVAKLREQCVGHWTAIGLDREWTSEDETFFLEAARVKRRSHVTITDPTARPDATWGNQ